jgi:DMSO/TMAO reductase YedYZ molybdopterin-dependent catalytic subunit
MDNYPDVKREDVSVDSIKVKISGNVENPYEFTYADFVENETVIVAPYYNCRKKSEVKVYNGVPVALVLAKAKPREGSSRLIALGIDGYKKACVLKDLMADQDAIITPDYHCLQLISKNEAISNWVRYLVELEVE